MQIKILFMDVDGTMTDGKIYMGSSGEVMKAFNSKDGYAIHNLLPAYGITPVVLTGRNSEIVKNRCKELAIRELHQGIDNKEQVLDEILGRLDCSYENTAYIGDDCNDLDCMMKVAVTGCPADACEEIKRIADFKSSKDGGDGAVREFIEWLVKEQKKEI